MTNKNIAKLFRAQAEELKAESHAEKQSSERKLKRAVEFETVADDIELEGLSATDLRLRAIMPKKK